MAQPLQQQDKPFRILVRPLEPGGRWREYWREEPGMPRLAQDPGTLAARRLLAKWQQEKEGF